MQEPTSRVTGTGDGAKTASDSAKPRARGLEGVIALESEICFIDGQAGELIYRGYDIHDLAQHTTFEEVVYLLWHGQLPNAAELETLTTQLQAERDVPPAVLDLFRAAPKETNPMAAIRTGISMLAHHDEEADDMSPEANYRKAVRLTAQTPTLIAAFDRIRKGKQALAPRKQGSTASDFLYMLNGEVPGAQAARTLDVCLVLHAEHGLNASTFTARVIASTLADMYAAVTGAVGALKGPLHGGANIEVMKMLLELDASGEDPADYIRGKLARKERIMGFGHRVYKTLDPRAASLREMLHRLSEERNDYKWFEIDRKIMETMEQEKGLYPNVDFFSAAVYDILGIDTDLYTPLFAMSRVAGYTAHLLEQWQGNRLIRPTAEYVGPRGRTVQPIEERA